MENKKIDDRIDENYERLAYFELIEELKNGLKNIPLEIKKAHIECKKAQFIFNVSKEKDMKEKAENIKKENIEKIEELKYQELEGRKLIERLEKKYGSFYNNLTLDKEKPKVVTGMMDKINNILKIK